MMVLRMIGLSMLPFFFLSSFCFACRFDSYNVFVVLFIYTCECLIRKLRERANESEM